MGGSLISRKMTTNSKEVGWSGSVVKFELTGEKCDSASTRYLRETKIPTISYDFKCGEEEKSLEKVDIENGCDYLFTIKSRHACYDQYMDSQNGTIVTYPDNRNSWMGNNFSFNSTS